MPRGQHKQRRSMSQDAGVLRELLSPNTDSDRDTYQNSHLGVAQPPRQTVRPGSSRSWPPVFCCLLVVWLAPAVPALTCCGVGVRLNHVFMLRHPHLGLRQGSCSRSAFLFRSKYCTQRQLQRNEEGQTQSKFYRAYCACKKGCGEIKISTGLVSERL